MVGEKLIQRQSYLFLRVIGLLLVWCLGEGGGGREDQKKGVLAKK